MFYPSKSTLKAVLPDCLSSRSSSPFMKLFSHKATPLDLICAYAFFCRGKNEAATDICDAKGIDRHVLLDISSLHQMLRQEYHWGNWRPTSSERPTSYQVAALIPARGDSKGIPLKNLAKLNGQSLLEIAIAKARESRFINRIIVDTDNDEIKREALKAGAEVLYNRPKVLAGDFSDLADAKLLTTFWLELMEGYWFDYLAVLTTPHPLWPVLELDKAFDKFIRSDHTSLITVVPTDFSWDAYYSLDGNKVDCIATRKSGSLYSRCGAFSISSRGPNKHYGSPQFKKLYPTQFTTMTYPLGQEHGYDIDTQEDLAKCERLVRNKDKVTTFTPAQCRAHLEKSELTLPDAGNDLTVIIHYPQGSDILAFNENPAFMRLLQTLSNNGISGKYVITGKSELSEVVAAHFGLPHIATENVLKRNGALYGSFIKALKSTFDSAGPTVYLNGYAGRLKSKSINDLIDVVRRSDRSFCTSLRTPDRPPQWCVEIKDDVMSPLTSCYIGFRQKIQTNYVQSYLLAGYGINADHRKHFTDHVTIDDCESGLLANAVNVIEMDKA